MEILTVLFAVLGLCCPHLSHQQRVAPGVPPQHYDPNLHQQQQYQQPPPPQFQQQQQQQQPPQQYQYQQPQQPGEVHHFEVPKEQLGVGQPQAAHQQPIQHQLPVVQQGHVPQQGHGSHNHGAMGHGGGGQPILDPAQMAQERQHIQEHMDLPIDTSQMSEQELQFHYFKMHDADNNNKLDGCELVKSLIHWHDQSNHDARGGQPIPEAKIFKDDELMQMIDPILENDDRNRDGFIDYAEFVQAQAAAAAKVNPVPSQAPTA